MKMEHHYRAGGRQVKAVHYVAGEQVLEAPVTLE
jgi:hypothetical protein